MQAYFAIPVLLALAVLMSEARERIPWRVVVGGVLLQVAIALLFLKIPAALLILHGLDDAVAALQSATDAGTTLVFGFLGGGALPYAETHPGASFILAFRALPLVLVISALASLLLHLGVLQRIVGAFAFVLHQTLGIGGALGLGAAVHIFVGMIEAPLLVRPYLRSLSRGELFALMSCGMAGIAGTMMVIYGTLLRSTIPDSFSHILIAAVLSTPGALAVSAVMVPFAVKAEEGAAIEVGEAASAMDAIVRGTMDGIAFVAGIVAMLIVLVALVTLVNMVVGLVSIGGAPLTLQRVFALGFRPLVWLIGVPWSESATAAQLMGTKTVLNEFVAFLDLAHLPDGALSPHARLVMTYALCGFANFGSLGIMLGGLSTMVPERRPDLVALGWKTIVSGTFATMMSASIAGLIAGV